jgi:hypothetical protein
LSSNVLLALFTVVIEVLTRLAHAEAACWLPVGQRGLLVFLCLQLLKFSLARTALFLKDPVVHAVVIVIVLGHDGLE